ncbi:zinc ribbon domain-containing protein [Microbacteriaceae bacterium 4G12]
MKVCGNCQKQVADHLNFCPECGTKVEAIVEHAAASQAEAKQEGKQEGKPVKKKKNTVILALVVVFVALLFGAYQFGAYQFSKEKQVKELIEAFNKKDINKINSFVKTDDPNLKITKDDIKSYLVYMKDNPSYNKDLVAYLQQQTVDSKLVDSKETFTDAKIVEDGKLWFLYPKYKLSIKPYYIVVGTSGKAAEIYVNDKKMTDISNEKSSKEVGPYFPGTYIVKAKAKTDLTTLESEKEVELTGEKDGKVKVELPLEGKFVTIESDEDNATVYVNGKKRGTLNHGSYKLGPVPTDETVEVYLEKKFDWGQAKTESVKIGDNSTYYLRFPKQATESDVGEFIRTHLYNSVRAISLNDFSLVEGEYDKSGKSYTEDRDYIAYLKKKGITEDLLRVEVRNAQRVSATQYKVTTYEEYDIRYGDGSVKFKSFNNEHVITVTPEGKLLYHSLASNTTLKDEQKSGPTSN